MSKRVQKKSEMWDVFRYNETPPPSGGSKSAFLPAIQKPSRENLQNEDTPRIMPKFEEMPNIEIRGRLRELEIQMLDLRAGIERRLSSVADEFPNRMNKELRIIQERDTFLWKENTQKQMQLSDSVKFIQESMKNAMDHLNNEVVLMKRRLDEVTVKNNNVVRDLELVNRVPRFVESVQQNDYSPLFNSFKEALIEERRKRETMQQEYNSQIQELQLIVRTSYVEQGKRLQEYRDQLFQAYNDVKVQVNGIDGSKEERHKNDQEYLRTVYSNLQRRLEEEVTQRTSLEKEYKMWTDSRLNAMQKIMKNEEKELVDRESKMLGMIQEGLSALHEIITKVKETSSASISKAQVMTNESLKDLTQALSGIKDSLYSRVENIEFSLQEESKLRTNGIDSVHKYIQKVSEGLDRQGLFMENQIMSSENRTKSVIYEIEQENIARDEKLKNWQISFNDHLESQVKEMTEKLEKLERDWEMRFKDAQEAHNLSLTDNKKTKIDLEASIDQLKNTINFEDGLIEQKVTNSVNAINDKIDRELFQMRNKIEKELAEASSDLFASLATRVDQIVRLNESQVKSAISEESKTRKSELEALENLTKQLADKTYAKASNDLNRELSDINERFSSQYNESQQLKSDLAKIRTETSNSLENLFSSIDEAKVTLQDWASKYTMGLIEDTKREVNVLVEVEREVLLKEIDKAKEDLRGQLEEVNRILSSGLEEEGNLGKKILNELRVEKENRVQGVKDVENRISELTNSMQDAVTHSSEAVKAVCRALVLKESAERNQGLESIMKSLQSRMTALEDLLKFYTSKASEELRAEFVEQVEKERNDRLKNELAQLQQSKKLKNSFKAHKEQQEIELTMAALLNSVIQQSTESTLLKQREDLESVQRKWVQNFEKELEDTSDDLRKQLENLEKTLNKQQKKSEKLILRKIEVKNLLDTMIGLIENDDTTKGIKESQGNIEILFSNMRKLEAYINESRNGLQEELGLLEKREAENNEENKEKLGKIEEKLEILDHAETQKSINLLMDQLEMLKEDLYKKQEKVDEITAMQEALNNQQIEFVKTKTEKDTEIQEALSILANSNAKIEQNLNEFQEKYPNLLKQVERHDEQLALLLSENNSS